MHYDNCSNRVAHFRIRLRGVRRSGGAGVAQALMQRPLDERAVDCRELQRRGYVAINREGACGAILEKDVSYGRGHCWHQGDGLRWCCGCMGVPTPLTEAIRKVLAQ